MNFYGGSPLNRLSWLRTSQAFLNTIVALPSAKWLLWNAGQPLTSTGSGKPAPIFLSIDDVAPLLGPAPYFGQGQEPGSHIVEHGAGEEHTDADHSPTAAARHLGVRVVFLGLFEKRAEDSTTALPTSELSNPQEALKKLDGTPYCALDVMDLEYTPEQMQAFLDGTTPGREGTQLAWAEPRALMSSLDASLAAIFANARSMTDWNQRNKVCPCALGSDDWNLSILPILVLCWLWNEDLLDVGRMEDCMSVIITMGRQHRKEALPDCVCQNFVQLISMAHISFCILFY